MQENQSGWAREREAGGYRTITFYTGDTMPVFLITVFGKGERSSLTQKESAALKLLTKKLIEEYRNKVTALERQQNASA